MLQTDLVKNIILERGTGGVWHEIIFWLMMESQVLLFKDLLIVHRAHQALGQNFNL